MGYKDYPHALKYLKKAIALKPDDSGALIDLSTVYLNMGDLDKAEAINNQLLRKGPTASAYNIMGLIDEAKGDLSKAEDSFNKGLAITHAYKELYFNLARVYWGQGQTKKAEELYLNILFEYPRENEARYALIRLYLSSGQIYQLQSMEKDVLATKNNTARDMVALGSLFASKGYLNIALDFFTKAVSIDYTFPDSYIEMGKLLYNQHRWGDAVRVWQMGLKCDPQDKRFDGLINQGKSHEAVF
jgi:tetratricopeptide (TPR) repeat protein